MFKTEQSQTSANTLSDAAVQAEHVDVEKEKPMSTERLQTPTNIGSNSRSIELIPPPAEDDQNDLPPPTFEKAMEKLMKRNSHGTRCLYQKTGRLQDFRQRYHLLKILKINFRLRCQCRDGST